MSAIASLPILSSCAAETGSSAEAPLTTEAPVMLGTSDSSNVSIGYLRDTSFPNIYCTVTLIDPQVVLTSAHCFSALANNCADAASVTSFFQVAFTPSGKVPTFGPNDSTVFPINAVTTLPGAFSPTASSCDGVPDTHTSCAKIQDSVIAGNDIALVRLAYPVPSALAKPIPVITSIADDVSPAHSIHATLDAAWSPLVSATPPNVLISGFGGSGDCSDRGRHSGAMAFERLGANWHSYCITPVDCVGAPTLPTTSICNDVITDDDDVVHVNPWGASRSIWGIKLKRLRHGGVVDGPIIAAGDSGGPAMIEIPLRGATTSQRYIIGTAGRSNNNGDCDRIPPQTSLQAWYSSTFSPDNGDWIERVLASWLDPPPPTKPYTPPGCTRDWITGALHCSPKKTTFAVE